MSKWDTEAALQMIQKFKVTNISGVPTQSWDILNHPKVDDYDLSSLIDIGAGGAAVFPDPPASQRGSAEDHGSNEAEQDEEEGEEHEL